MRRRGAAGEARHGEIETAPEEMHRAAFASEAGAESFEHRFDARQCAMQALRAVGPILAGSNILRKRNRIGNFIRLAMKARRQPVRIEHRDQRLVKRRDATEVERKLVDLAVAAMQDDRMARQVEGQRKAGSVGHDRLDRQALRNRVEGHMPAMIEPRHMGDAQLAEHLAGEVQQRECRLVAFDID